MFNCFLATIAIYALTVSNIFSSSSASSILSSSLISDNENKKEINFKNQDVEWRIVFYTGRQFWAGTDSDIYVELIGEQGNSKIIQLSPNKNQLEANSIDSFDLGDLDGRQIGELRSIIVGKQYTFGFFSDWELLKVEVFNSAGKKYVLNCNCWLTNTKNKKFINLTSYENVPNIGSGDPYPLTRSSRLFPITIVLLALFLILILFSYFGNVICKKWRENIQFLTGLRNNSTRNSRGHRHNRRADSSNPNDEYGITNQTNGQINVSRNVYNLQDQTGVNIPLNSNIRGLIEDKPPDYKELFPNQEESTSIRQKSSTPPTPERQNPHVAEQLNAPVETTQLQTINTTTINANSVASTNENQNSTSV